MAITDLTNTTWEFTKMPTTGFGKNYAYFQVDTYAHAGSYETTSSEEYNRVMIRSKGTNYAEFQSFFTPNNTTSTGHPYPYFQLFSDDTNKVRCVIANGEVEFISFPFYLTITGGTDATNADLISWLESSANQIKPDPTVTFDLTTLDLTEGTHTITVIGKADGYKASAASASVSYTVEPSTVTIPKGTYVCQDEPNLLTLQIYSTAINFISNDTNYTSMGYEADSDGKWLTYGSDWVYLDNGGWGNTNYKTVKLDTDQTVSAEFGTWFNSNFTKQADTVTIEAGTYVAKNSIDTSPQFSDIELSFTSNNTSYAYMAVGIYADPFFTEIVYIKDNFDATIAYNANTQWANTAYKTITLSTPQSVAPEFGEWFNGNFTKQLPTPRIDVSINGESRGYIDLSYYVAQSWYAIGATKEFTTSDGTNVTMYTDYQSSGLVKLIYANNAATVRNGSIGASTYADIENSVYTCNISVVDSND